MNLKITQFKFVFRWGGCIVALCDSHEISKAYIDELKKSYYANLPQAQDRNLDHIVFATSPQSGAVVYVY